MEVTGVGCLWRAAERGAGGGQPAQQRKGGSPGEKGRGGKEDGMQRAVWREEAKGGMGLAAGRPLGPEGRGRCAGPGGGVQEVGPDPTKGDRSSQQRGRSRARGVWRGGGARGQGPPHPTFQAADPPEPRVGEAAGVLLLRGATAPAVGRRVVAGREVGRITDEGARVQPVVGADGDGHEAEGCEGAHRGQQHLHPLLAPEAPLFVPALQRLQFDHGEPGGRGPPPGQRGRGRAGGWGGSQRRQKWGPGAGRAARGRRGGGAAREGVRGRPWAPAGGGRSGHRVSRKGAHLPHRCPDPTADPHYLPA